MEMNPLNIEKNCFLPDQVPADEIRISSALLLNLGFKSTFEDYHLWITNSPAAALKYAISCLVKVLSKLHGLAKSHLA